MNDEADETNAAPGWDAIDEALRPLYGEREPLHFGVRVPYALGGPDPLHGISAYKNLDPTPHWHYVTYGFSELWEKETTDPEVSGYGFELTFRCCCEPDADKPPNWALNFLQNIARYVFQTGNTYGAGHTLPLNGPIAVGSPTLIHAVSFTLDPLLPPISTPNGEVQFLQVVGMTMDELDAITSWNASSFLTLRKNFDPLLLTDISRSSWMNDPAFAAEVQRLAAEEGSSSESMSIVLQCATDSHPIRIIVQSIIVDALRRRLLSRLPFGRTYTLEDSEAVAVFKPGEPSSVSLAEGAVIVTLSNPDLQNFSETLQPHAGVYPIPGIPDAILQVTRTEIKDRDGNVVDVVE